MTLAAARASAGWHASLALEFSTRDARSVLTHRAHHGPLHVQKAFYPEADGTCHMYLLHPPGGVVGGDTLQIDLVLHSGAQALLTTPAATKFYRSGERYAAQMLRAQVANAATLEWLPQETIVFNSAWARSRTRVELARDARFIGWEVVCLGRPVNHETFTHGAWQQRLEVWRDATPLFIDRSDLHGNAPVLTQRWGWAGYSISGVLVCATLDLSRELLETLREACAALQRDGVFTATQLRGVLVCRYLGHHAQHARTCLQRAWEILRPEYLGKAAQMPRIWNT
ncbi:MAG: urease accessory protein UreD [Gammaproteobacteria bacterium]|nr:urease accessory protein UreD [Gammaproteobacteria bacterium]